MHFSSLLRQRFLVVRKIIRHSIPRIQRAVYTKRKWILKIIHSISPGISWS